MDQERAREPGERYLTPAALGQRLGLLPQGMCGKLPTETPAQREWAAFIERQRNGYGDGGAR